MSARRNPVFMSAMLGLLLGVAAPAAQALEIKVASVAPDGSSWLDEMRAGTERIEQRTDGRVEFKFYPGGVMGSDTQVLRKIRVGQLHGGAFTAGGLGERYPALNLYGVPLLFRSLDEVDYVRERLDPKLQAGLEEAGFVSFGFIEGGFANLMSRNEPVASVDDLRRKKVWVPEGDEISYMTMDALGLSPVFLPVTDVLTGLQTGLIDVVATPPTAALVLQWHTKVRYRTELPVAYSMGVFALDKRVFERLSEEDRAVVREVMTDVVSELDRAARQNNRRAREVLTESGVEPVEVNSSDVEGWRRQIEDVYPELRRRSDVDGEMLDELLDVLAEYRSRGSSP